MTVNRPTLPFVNGRLIGLLWVVSIVGGIYGILIDRRTIFGQDALLIAGGAFIAAIALLYELLKPVNPGLSLAAALFGLTATIALIASGDTSFYGGLQCLLVGYLIFNSSFLPRVIGVLTAIGGLGQLIFLSTLLPASLMKPFASIGYITDGVGEGALALWLLVMGVSTIEWAKVRDAAR